MDQTVRGIRRKKPVFLVVLLFTLIATAVIAQPKGTKKRRPLPEEYGNVVLNNFAERNGVAPVVFSHWLHRSKFTCRLCHVDLGFAMQANGTGLHELQNQKGLYCGACHNGRIAFGATTPKTATSAEVKNCDRCHSFGKSVPGTIDFSSIVGGVPRGRFGNNVDWEAAELEGKLKLTDTLPEISIRRKPLDVPKDYSIEARIDGLPEIIFSHKKHAVWHGCELCHPDIFMVKAGGTKYTMEEIFAGKYCGLCHGSVAFPASDCQRCHTKPVA